MPRFTEMPSLSRQTSDIPSRGVGINGHRTHGWPEVQPENMMLPVYCCSCRQRHKNSNIMTCLSIDASTVLELLGHSSWHHELPYSTFTSKLCRQRQSMVSGEWAAKKLLRAQTYFCNRRSLQRVPVPLPPGSRSALRSPLPFHCSLPRPVHPIFGSLLSVFRFAHMLWTKHTGVWRHLPTA